MPAASPRSSSRQAYERELERLRAIPQGSGGDFYLTLAARVSKRFARALVISTLEGQTLHRDAFRLLGFSKLATFHELGQQPGGGVMAYLLDANVFIQAKNLHYGLDFCPAFWDWLIDEQCGASGSSASRRSADEIDAGGDELADWAAQRGTGFFLRPDSAMLPALGTVSTWATGQRLRACGGQHVPPGGRLLPGGPRARPRSPRRHPRGRGRLNQEDQDPQRLHRPRHQVHDAVRDAPPRARAICPGGQGMTMPGKHTESAFEDAIEHSLITAGGWIKGDASGFDRERALSSAELFAFVEATQADLWAELRKQHGPGLEQRRCLRPS